MKISHAIVGAIALVCSSPAYSQIVDTSQSMYIGSPDVLPRQAAAARSRGASSHAGSAPFDIRTNSQLLAEAQRYVGSGKITRMAGPWCRDFINLVASRAGYRLANHSRRAIDAVHLGTRVSYPQPGDLVVMRHHVTIYAGHDAGRIVGLGGNQGHRVRYSHYDQRRVVAFVRL